jgi:hypothetical protein
MATMDRFDHILNWKLKAGSHPFPGPDGGTCINEAALVAAGFDYKPIYRVEEMPDCFSRPICRFAMRLNDDADDDERQRLLPFVTRLACADTLTVECIREIYITSRVRKHVTFEQGLEILQGALAIGRQTNDLGFDTVKTRMETARSQAAAASSDADRPLLSKLKGWFGAAVKTETAP